MALDPQVIARIKAGMPVIGYGGDRLGNVREVYPHFLLVGAPDQPHLDREVQTNAILRIEGGTVYVSVTRDSVDTVDDAETAHRVIGDDR